MNLRQTDIAKKLSDWLERFSVPIHLRDKSEAAQKEAESLARILCKFAPLNDYQPFLNRVFDVVEIQARHRAWPTVAEIGAVCSNLRKEAAPGMNEVKLRDAAEINAERMANGHVVAEGYLYGLAAVEMIARHLVSEPAMRNYRSGAFLARRDLYGEPAALAWEAEAKARHEAAKEVYRHRGARRGYGAPVPDMRVRA